MHVRDGDERKACTRRQVVMIILQVYIFLRHSLQMKYLKRNTKNLKTTRPPVKVLAMVVETETFFSEA